MTAAFTALAEPTRRQILDLLRHHERPVGDLVDALAVSQPAVSKHLRVLRDAGLVSVRTDAQRRLYRVRLEPLRDLDDWLAPFRAQWAQNLDRLEAHLDATPDDPDDPNDPDDPDDPGLRDPDGPGARRPSASRARARRS